MINNEYEGDETGDQNGVMWKAITMVDGDNNNEIMKEINKMSIIVNGGVFGNNGDSTKGGKIRK